jgi:hypothetical protein
MLVENWELQLLFTKGRWQSEGEMVGGAAKGHTHINKIINLLSRLRNNSYHLVLHP